MFSNSCCTRIVRNWNLIYGTLCWLIKLFRLSIWWIHLLAAQLIVKNVCLFQNHMRKNHHSNGNRKSIKHNKNIVVLIHFTWVIRTLMGLLRWLVLSFFFIILVFAYYYYYYYCLGILYIAIEPFTFSRGSHKTFSYISWLIDCATVRLRMEG